MSTPVKVMCIFMHLYSILSIVGARHAVPSVMTPIDDSKARSNVPHMD